MKKMLISLGFAAATIFAAQAQETPQEPQEQTPGTELSQDNRKELQESELPESVQTGLEDSEYADWDLVRIYEVTDDQGMIVYEIVVFDGTNEATVQFDESGNITEGQYPEDQTQPNEFEQGVGQELEQEAEDVGQDIEQGAEEAGQEIDKAAEEVGQEAEDVGQDIEQGAQEAGQEIEQETQKAEHEHEVEHKVTESGEVKHEVESKTGEEMKSEQDTASSSIEGEGIKKISESELPQEIKDALKNDTDYKNATIEQAFELSGAALDRALDEVTPDSIYGEDYKKMYQLQVSTEDNKSAVIYITEEGDVFAEKEM